MILLFEQMRKTETQEDFITCYMQEARHDGADLRFLTICFSLDFFLLLRLSLLSSSFFWSLEVVEIASIAFTSFYVGPRPSGHIAEQARGLAKYQRSGEHILQEGLDLAGRIWNLSSSQQEAVVAALPRVKRPELMKTGPATPARRNSRG